MIFTPPRAGCFVTAVIRHLVTASPVCTALTHWPPLACGYLIVKPAAKTSKGK